MEPDGYPTVDADFVKMLIINSGRIEGTVQYGDTTTYVLKGAADINRRLIYFPNGDDSQVTFSFVTAIGNRLKCIGDVTDWWK
jgi:hypothetical protein